MTEPSSRGLIDQSRPHLVVLGLMGVGKSTTAQAFARSRGLPCHDSDLDLETVFGHTGGELASRHGVDELHRLDSAMLLGRLASEQPSVISAAAWVVEDKRCHEALARRATVVVLHAPTSEILRRAATSDHRRVMTQDELEALAVHRAPMFAAVSDLDLDATLPTDALVGLIADRALGPGPR